MSKQSEAKRKQEYTPSPIMPVCKNCVFFKSDFVRGDSKWNSHVEYERNMRCERGGFAVKKMASCKEYQKQEGAEA